MLSNGTPWRDEIKEAFEYKAIDIQVGWRHVSNTPYNYIYRYPNLGLGFNMTLTHSQEIGRPLAIYGFMEIPFSIPSFRHRLKIGYFTQLGLGFNLKPFDEFRNPINQNIGSKLNSYVHLGLNATIRITERLDLQASLGLKHFSNGSAKKPNSGINLIPLNMGFQLKVGEVKPIPGEKPSFEKKSLPPYWNFMLYSGLKNYDVGEPEFFRGGIGISYVIPSGYKYRYGLGLDFFWAQGAHIRNPDLLLNFRDKTSFAVVGTWEWQLTDNLFIPVGIGAYLYRNELNQEITWYYERLGVRYRHQNRLFFGIQIKAHQIKADFFELTLGYTIPSSL